jgi:hypothetical protein
MLIQRRSSARSQYRPCLVTPAHDRFDSGLRVSGGRRLVFVVLGNSGGGGNSGSGNGGLGGGGGGNGSGRGLEAHTRPLPSSALALLEGYIGWKLGFSDENGSGRAEKRTSDRS